MQYSMLRRCFSAMEMYSFLRGIEVAVRSFPQYGLTGALRSMVGGVLGDSGRLIPVLHQVPVRLCAGMTARHSLGHGSRCRGRVNEDSCLG